MADHVETGGDIFVYTGGRAPDHVVNAVIDESVEEIDDYAFFENPNLKSVVCHDGVLKVGAYAFSCCYLLQHVKMTGVKIIEEFAFYCCRSFVTGVELYNLERIERFGFDGCTSLKKIKMPKVKIIGKNSFKDSGVQNAEFGEDLETIVFGAFWSSSLRRIAIPLKDEMLELSPWNGSYGQFRNCINLTTVDLVGGIHKTVASLHLESWRNEMTEEIQRINQILPGTNCSPFDDTNSKGGVTRQWIQSVIGKIDHYKAEHRALLKEATTLLELALWKAQLHWGKEGDSNMVGDEKETDFEEVKLTKKAKMDLDSKRKARVTCGADVVIKNVMPFLILE